MKKNVTQYVENAICIGCGGCSAYCPMGAIAMDYNETGFLYAKVDSEKCINCGKCLKVCPNNFDYKESDLEKAVKGKYSGTYLCYALNPQDRLEGQSGGVVTSLLKYLLDSHTVEKVIVNSFSEEHGINITKAVTESEELSQTKGSFYAQSSVVKKIAENCESRLAAVVLGCQGQSYRMWESCNKEERDDYIIGLVCECQNSRIIVDNLLNKAKVGREEKVIDFRFRDKRCGGVPGNVHIVSEKGEYCVDGGIRRKLFHVYKCYRCYKCIDKMNVCSDVVCMDPWGIDSPEVKKGCTVVLIRTEKGRLLMEKAIEEGYIYAESLDTEKVFSGQNINGNYFAVKCVQNQINFGETFDLNHGVIYNTNYAHTIYKKVERNMRYAFEYYQAKELSGKKMASIKERKINMVNKAQIPYAFFKRAIRYLRRKFKEKIK